MSDQETSNPPTPQTTPLTSIPLPPFTDPPPHIWIDSCLPSFEGDLTAGVYHVIQKLNNTVSGAGARYGIAEDRFLFVHGTAPCLSLILMVDNANGVPSSTRLRGLGGLHVTGHSVGPRITDMYHRLRFTESRYVELHALYEELCVKGEAMEKKLRDDLQTAINLACLPTAAVPPTGWDEVNHVTTSFPVPKGIAERVAKGMTWSAASKLWESERSAALHVPVWPQ